MNATNWKVAVAVTVDFDAHSPWMGSLATPTPSALSRGEFGVNVGIPRLLRLLRELDIRSTWPTPGHDLVTFPRAVEQVMSGGHEIAAHGCFHENIMSLAPERERKLMEIQLRQHLDITGIKPRGYRSPAWDFTDQTLQLLEEFGFDWDSSLMGTEFEPYHPRPVTIQYEEASTFGRPSPLVEIPVSWYLDDWPATEFVNNVSPGIGDHRSMFQRWREIFDYAYHNVPGAIYTLTVHPQCIGRAHHMAGFEALLRYFRNLPDVWWPTLSEVCDHWLADTSRSVREPVAYSQLS